MRIIAGEFRHRILISPPTRTTRPITDRAKQSLFDALTVAVDLSGGGVLDCFSGTGSMGLECLSRGARRAIFIERDRDALAGLGKNIATLGVVSQCRVLAMDAYRMGPTTLALTPDWGDLRVAFVDPPYAHLQEPGTRALLDGLVETLANGRVAAGGLIVLRHATATDLGEMALARRIVRRLQYGTMAITWLKSGVLPGA
jgi:16S rRNA (guanine966-N2)-methyltransferase